MLGQPTSHSTLFALQASPMNRSSLPLCIDLDGTLVYTDTFDESLAKALRSPWALLKVFAALRHGKARTKAALARYCTPDPALLPYNKELGRFLDEERARGRQLVLVTAANEHIAQSVAEHVGVFDEVMASSPTRNIRGAEKGKALVERFGEKGFVYAGNDHTDLDVWPLGAAAITVNAPRSVSDQLQPDFVERDFPRDPRPNFVGLLRLKHWWKNLVGLLPLGLLLSSDPSPWPAAVSVLLILTLLMSSAYVLNDLFDLEQDRAAGSTRPLALGHYPVRSAFVLVGALGLISGMGGLVVGGLPALLALLAVGGLHVLYSAWAQNHRLAATPTLACLYLARLNFGAVVFCVPLDTSLWGVAAGAGFMLAAAGRRCWPAIDET